MEKIIMSKTSIKSNTIVVDKPIEKVYAFLSDFNNFQKLMPAQVTNWTSTADNCSFTIQGMATIGMKIVERNPNESIRITSDGKVPFTFDLLVDLRKTGESSTEGNLLFNAEMNPFMQMMVEKPLTNFFNMLADKVKDIDF
jgi:carbon monoxide dehydrogenase subunit G